MLFLREGQNFPFHGSLTRSLNYFFLYILLNYRSLIIVNMYIAVILENYTQAKDDVNEGITDEDYDMFYEVWVEFDPESTMYIPYESIGELLDCLEPPLQIPRQSCNKVYSKIFMRALERIYYIITYINWSTLSVS